MAPWRVPLMDLNFGEEEAEAACRVIRSRWLTMGAEVQAFEEEFAAALGAGRAVAVTNGTAALHLAYLAAGLAPGDEFCLSALTFVATMNAGLYIGARPVLVDCASADDLTMCSRDLERKITPRTRLISVVPYGGFAPDMDRLVTIAEERGIPLIEDACHAPLAELSGRKIGTFGLASCWSFYGNKNMTTGEGGMVVTNDGDFAARVRLLRSHGMTSLTWQRHHRAAKDYDVTALGYNYRMDEVRAAIGRVQLRKLAEATAARSRAAQALRQALESLRTLGLLIPFSKPRGTPAHHLFVVLLPEGADRSAVRQSIHDRGVQTSVHYPQLSGFSHVRDAGLTGETPVVNSVADRLLTLPLGPSLNEEQIDEVRGALEEALIRFAPKTPKESTA